MSGAEDELSKIQLKTLKLIQLIELLTQKPWKAADLKRELGLDPGNELIYRYLKNVEELSRVLGLDYRHDAARGTHHIEPKAELGLVDSLVTHAALRMMAHHAPGNSRQHLAALRKLAKNLPPALRDIAVKSTEALERREGGNLGNASNLEQIIEAWRDRRRIAFSYKRPGDKKPYAVELEVYFVEVSRANMDVYLIAKDILNARDIHYLDNLRTYKLDRIVGAVRMLETTYIIPDDFDPTAHLSTAWGIVAGPSIKAILKFPPSAAERIREGGYPNLKVVEAKEGQLEDGYILAEIVVGTDSDGFPLELLPWIQSWGPRVEVLEPENLRKVWLEEARAIVEKYGGGDAGGSPPKDQYWAHTPRDKRRTVSSANPPHGLVEHTEKVAELARAAAEKFGAAELAYTAGIWHDLGKFNPEFQSYLRACHSASMAGTTPPAKSTPHAIYGATFAAREYSDSLESLALLIAGHHAGLPTPAEAKSRTESQEVIAHTQEFAKSARGAGLVTNPGYDIEGVLSSQPQDEIGFEMLLRFVFSSLVDADFVDTERHFDPKKAALRNSAESLQAVRQLWDQLQIFQGERGQKPGEVNAVRAEVLSSCLESAQQRPGLFRLLVPTGGGKTLSGLAFALRHAVENGLERVIFAVPYTSIIDQTVKVYRDIFGVEAVLEHHSASREDAFVELENGDEERIRAKLAVQNWDAPLVVTTTVQLFESLFSNYPSKCRKLHNLSKAVIVLDEVQTLPVSLLQPIVSVLGELASERYGSSIVLCTATQPALEVESKFFKGFGAGRVRDIVQPEQVRQHFRRLKRVEYETNLEPVKWDDLAERLSDETREPQALVVLNTRKDALALLEALQRRYCDGLLHLSTLLCGAHRYKVLEEVRGRLNPDHPRPVILVSTQVVEAGVDLDFPTVYRAMGPLERLVQAAGRCNREGRRERGRVVIFNPAEGSAPGGEYATALAEASRKLTSGVDLHDPGIFESYYELLYAGIPTDKHGIQNLRRSFNFPEVAAKFNLINDDTKPVVIPYDDTAREIIERIRKRGFLLASEYRALQPYVVNLRRKEFEANQTLAEEVRDVKDLNGVNIWHGSYDRELRGVSTAGWAIEDLVW